MKKIIIIPALLVIILLKAGTVHAKIFNSDTNTPLNKEWKIQFNSDIDADSINKSRLYVTDSTGQKFNISYNINGNTVTLKHTDSQFTPNEKYTVHVAAGIRDTNGKVLKTEVTKDFITSDENYASKEVVDLDLPENRSKFNLLIGACLRVAPVSSGYKTKDIYVASVVDATTKEAFTNIPDNIMFKKSLSIYKYIQPIKSFTDFNVLLSDTQFLSKVTMTFTKEKPYFVKEFNIDVPSIGYTQGLCFVAKTITETSTLYDGLYMDGGICKNGTSSVDFKGPYDDTKKYIPIDLVDKDYTVKKYINPYPYSYYSSESESKAADDKYTYKVDFVSQSPGIYKIDNVSGEKSKIADGDGSIYYIDKNYIYYSVSSDNYTLSRMNKDGTGKVSLGVDFIRELKYDNGWFYFTTSRSGANMYKMKTDGSVLTPIGNDQAESFMDQYDGYIYYENYSDGDKLYRIKTDGTNREKISDLDISGLSITIRDDRIYYLYNQNIYKMKLDGTEISSL
ncbi:DUF5050 domain-containing protein [Clostridium neuense]|uniref:DUF5050 domain-containing protein n=1 Tax=Clostridium neuense TaxID=1728934 RepID=A0ABW8TJC7_9CLOT